MVYNIIVSCVKWFFGICFEDEFYDVDFYDDGFYFEFEFLVKEVLVYLVFIVDGIKYYFRELFLFWGWIFYYNLIWLFGDFIVGKYCLLVIDLVVFDKFF